MSGTRQNFLCEAVAAVKDGKLFITVSKVNDGVEFETGHGDVKYGSPRPEWTPELIKYEIARAFGAQSVEIRPRPGQATPVERCEATPPNLVPGPALARSPARSSARHR
jgi:hypothetical protein